MDHVRRASDRFTLAGGMIRPSPRWAIMLSEREVMPRTSAALACLIARDHHAHCMLRGQSGRVKYGQTRRKAACAGHLGQMHIALSLFAAEHNGAFPVVAGATTSEAPLSELVPRYTTDTSIFLCPGRKPKALPGAEPFVDRRISYAYYMGRTLESPPDAPLVTDAQANLHAKQKGDALFSTNGSAPGHNHRAYGGTPGHAQ